MFKAYNEKSCLFECRLRFSMRRSGCIPWEYPHPSEPPAFDFTHICSSNPNNTINPIAVFEDAMNSPESMEDCNHCLPNCEEVVFKTQVIAKLK